MGKVRERNGDSSAVLMNMKKKPPLPYFHASVSIILSPPSCFPRISFAMNVFENKYPSAYYSVQAPIVFAILLILTPIPFPGICDLPCF
jgi:hypothetical protein